MHRFLVLIILVFGWLPTTAVGTSESFYKELGVTYNFEPKDIPSEQLAEKAKALDRFWSFVKANSAEYAPLLRRALGGNWPTSFFHFDGARLLLDLSNSDADKVLALQSLAKTDLRSVAIEHYVKLAHSLAAANRDASDVALKLLDTDEFQFAIPVHPGHVPMYTQLLNRESSIICILGKSSEDTYVSKAGTRLMTELDPAKQKALAMLLYIATTPQADKYLNDFLASTTITEPNKKGLANLIQQTKKDVLEFPADKRPKETPSQLREQRRESMRDISAENINEFYRFTGYLKILQ